MRKKIIVILAGMLLITTAISIQSAKDFTHQEVKMTISKLSERQLPLSNEQLAPLDIEITSPEQGYLYIGDRKVFPLLITTLIVGSITVNVNITSGVAEKVEFYVDDELQHEDYTMPFKWNWDETVFFTHTIKVIAYNETGSSVTKNVSVLMFNLQFGQPSLTKEEAIQILLDEVIDPTTLDHTLYAFTLDAPLVKGDKIAPWLPDPLPQSIEFFPYLEERELEKSEWFFWIDDAPRARFQHSNRFVFIEASTGNVNVVEEQWWPVLNNVSLWNSSEEYWNPENWAYTNDVNRTSPSLSSLSSPLSYVKKTSPIQSGRGENGAIVINGWSRGQSGGDDMAKDAAGMGTFWGTYPGFDTVKVNPPNNNQSNIENAFNSTSDNNDVVVYIVGHGGIDASGEPYVSSGGQKVTEDELCDMAANNPNTTYKWVIDCCHSGAFIASLKNLNNSAKVITACAGNESSYGDWDPPQDPNPSDQGGEFSSGFLEDLWEEWLNNPLIGILELLDKSYTSAVAKDACAIRGYTHPQVWEKIDVDPPIVSITFPENNTIITDPNPIINISGFAADTLSGIVMMDWLVEYEEGTPYYDSIIIEPPEHWIDFNLEIPLQLGMIQVTVGATDSTGLYGSDSITIFWFPR